MALGWLQRKSAVLVVGMKINSYGNYQEMNNLWVRWRDSYFAFNFDTSWYQLCIDNQKQHKIIRKGWS